MHAKYILHTYLKNIEYGLDLEFDTREEVQQIMDKALEALSSSDMKHGLLKISPDLVINIEDFVAMKISELTYCDETEYINPWKNQTVLDDFFTTTTEVNYDE